jgi:hypothetical protein
MRLFVTVAPNMSAQRRRPFLDRIGIEGFGMEAETPEGDLVPPRPTLRACQFFSEPVSSWTSSEDGRSKALLISSPRAPDASR